LRFHANPRRAAKVKALLLVCLCVCFDVCTHRIKPHGNGSVDNIAEARFTSAGRGSSTGTVGHQPMFVPVLGEQVSTEPQRAAEGANC
jgi:hypothetical protein